MTNATLKMLAPSWLRLLVSRYPVLQGLVRERKYSVHLSYHLPRLNVACTVYTGRCHITNNAMKCRQKMMLLLLKSLSRHSTHGYICLSSFIRISNCMYPAYLYSFKDFLLYNLQTFVKVWDHKRPKLTVRALGESRLYLANYNPVQGSF